MHAREAITAFAPLRVWFGRAERSYEHVCLFVADCLSVCEHISGTSQSPTNFVHLNIYGRG